MLVLVLQRSRSWAEKASKGAGFALTNMKRKDNPSPEPVTFTLNFRQAQHLPLAPALPVQPQLRLAPVNFLSYQIVSPCTAHRQDMFQLALAMATGTDCTHTPLLLLKRIHDRRWPL